MNEKLTGLLAGLKQEPIDAFALAELRHPEIVVEAIEKIRAWAGIPVDAAGRATSQQTLAILLGHGRDGLLRLHAGFAEDTARTEAESIASFDGLRRLARQARGTRVTTWDLDGLDVKPWIPGAAGKPKLYCELRPGLDERVRAVAAKRGESLREFVEVALADRLASIERRHRPRRRKGIATPKNRPAVEAAETRATA
jgi:hypothetical protein